MALYISVADVKPRLLGYGKLVRPPDDPARGQPAGLDADGFPVRYVPVIERLIRSSTAAVDNCLRTEFDGKDAEKRLFWQPDGDWDIDLPRARAISKVCYRSSAGDKVIAKTGNWETLPGYDSFDSQGIRRVRRLGAEPWACGEYWITGDWGYSPETVPEDIKDGLIDQVHYRFSMLPGTDTATLQLYDGGDVKVYGGLLWSGQMYGTLLYHATARGLTG